jgi:hypothetical protein
MSPSCGADPERGTQNDADLDHDADPGLGGGSRIRKASAGTGTVRRYLLVFCVYPNVHQFWASCTVIYQAKSF